MSPKKKRSISARTPKVVSTPKTGLGFTEKLRRFIEDLREFLETARKDVFWLAASGVLSAVFLWQLHTAFKVIPALLTFERDSNRFNSDAREGNKVLLLLDTIKNVLGTFQQITNQYEATFAGRYPVQVDPTAVSRGLTSIRAARRQAEESLSVIHGTQFNEGTLEAYRTGIEDDLRKLNAQMLEIERVYSTWEEGDVKAHATAFRSLKDGPDSSTDLIALSARLHSFMEEPTSLQRGWLFDVIEGREGEKVFTAGEIAFTVGLLYELGFLIVGVIAFRKHRAAKGSAK
jgi:hypothetical protein